MFWQMHSCVTTTTIKIESTFGTPMPPLLPSFAVSPSSTLAATDLFSYSFAFPVCHINSVMWYVTFWTCLLSVSTVHFRLIHVLVCIHTSLVFLLLRSILLHGCTTISPFTNWRMFVLFPVLGESWLWKKLLYTFMYTFLCELKF